MSSATTPVSSRTSRTAACSAFSPGSTCPFGSASTREPSGARRVGTITTTRSPRSTTPPAEISCARGAPLRFLRLLEDILLQRLSIVDNQATSPLGDHAGALQYRQEAAGRLARGARELRQIGLGGRHQHVPIGLAEIPGLRGLLLPLRGVLRPLRALVALYLPRGQLLLDELTQDHGHATLDGLEGLA